MGTDFTSNNAYNPVALYIKSDYSKPIESVGTLASQFSVSSIDSRGPILVVTILSMEITEKMI